MHNLSLFVELLFCLYFIHFLCDFALQNDYVASAKSPFENSGVVKKDTTWFFVMTAHCMIHAGCVYLITKSLMAAITVLVTHFVIDVSKCRNRISFATDQVLHLSILTAIAVWLHLTNKVSTLWAF